jgi:hypothetical protein
MFGFALATSTTSRKRTPTNGACSPFPTGPTTFPLTSHPPPSLTYSSSLATRSNGCNLRLATKCVCGFAAYVGTPASEAFVLIDLKWWSQRAVGKFFSTVYMNGGRFACFNQTGEETRRPDASARRTGFDWLLFQVMLEDKPRLAAYRRDIERSVRGARVLEIGPGPKAVLSAMCLDSGVSSLISVEGDPWVASQAASRLKRRGIDKRWTLIPKLSTKLSPADVGNDTAFDVLVCEIYDSIACREQVAETIADLKARGFSFGSIISRGFETWVAPCKAPPSAKMSRVERLALGWGWRDAASTQLLMNTHPSTMHGDHPLISSLCLTSGQRWQHSDFETDGSVFTAPSLEFSVTDPAAQTGFLFWNRFLFHDGESLNTLSSPTNWGVTYVPLKVDLTAARPELELITSVPDAARPSAFSLRARSASHHVDRVFL